MVTKFLRIGEFSTRLRSRSGGKAGAMETVSKEGGRQLAAPLVPGLHAIPAAHIKLIAQSEKNGKATSM